MMVPEITIRWILKNACTSNCDLAAVSNVNKYWRSIAYSFLKDFLICAIDSGDMSEYEHISNLLLPDMALEIIRRFHQQRKFNDEQSHTNRIKEAKSFCLAWFAPSGIKLQSVNLNAFSDEEMFSSSNSSSSDDGGENDEMNFYRQRMQQRANEVKDVSDATFESCCSEWQGQRDPMDVLSPLDYSIDFVEAILNMAAELCNNKQYTFSNLTDNRQTTIAVRGAVFARPLLFCLCWDADHAESKINSELSILDSDSIVEKGQRSYKVMDLQRRRRKHDKMRRIRMRQGLPRVITSAEVKNPLLQDPDYGILGGRKQRSLQFLNADRSRAVYIRTPPFDCGPVQGPVTMFCVGIATEDGCFVSGLENRFELGHLYGVNVMDKAIDMSPICICAEAKIIKNSTNNDKNIVKSYSEDMSDSSNEDYQINRKGSILCQCQIQYHKGNNDDNSCESQTAHPDQKNIFRGQMGPGRWHCYTAIFNGNESIIRVDGCTEKINNPSNTNDKNKSVLDGLTIGSDHCFEMPLCFGSGSDGEGEGSIAELVVFKGTMSIQDIEKYEKYLMSKHGIVHGHQHIFPQIENNLIAQNIGNQWQEDIWRRQAHALISHSPFYDIGNVSIPLRIAANHKSVAWHRINRVTGQQLNTVRIGAKHSNGSSDW